MEETVVGRRDETTMKCLLTDETSSDHPNNNNSFKSGKGSKGRLNTYYMYRDKRLKSKHIRGNKSKLRKTSIYIREEAKGRENTTVDV